MRIKFMSVILSSALALAGAVGSQEADPAANRVFGDLIRKSREHPSVHVVCDLTVLGISAGQPMEEQSLHAEFTRSKDGDGLITFDGYTIHIHGGFVHVTHKSNADEFFVAAGEKFVNSAIIYDCFGFFARIPFPHLTIFWGEDDLAELAMELYADTAEIVPVGVADRVVGDQSVRTLEFKGPETTMLVNFDPRTMVIRGITHRTSSAMLVREGEVTSSYSFETTIHDVPLPASTFAFVQGDRQRIDDMANLRKDKPAEEPPQPPEEPIEMPPPAGALVGKEAPLFEIRSPQGDAFNLGAMKGEVIVLDFWAVWCPPCRKALPKLHEVAAWASEENLPVRFYAINTFENGRTAEDKKKTATRYWADTGLTLPILMDDENAVASLYGVTGIPTIFVIDANGVVTAHHDRFDEARYVEDLKTWIREALGRQE